MTGLFAGRHRSRRWRDGVRGERRPYRDTLIGNGGYNPASAAAACSRAMDRRGQTPSFVCFA